MTLRTPPARRRARVHPVVWTLALAMIGIEAVQIAAEAGLAPPILRRWVVTTLLGFFDAEFEAARRGTVYVKLLWSFFTHPFVHVHALHLVVNLVPLVAFAHVITRVAGVRVFLILFFGSAAMGAVALGLLAQVGAPMVGASGAVAGLVGAVAIWLRRPLVWVAILGLMLVDSAIGLGAQGDVAWEAHLGGLLAGSALALALGPRQAMRRHP